jgi:hypothetical protein
LTNSNEMVGVAKRTFHTNESVVIVKANSNEAPPSANTVPIAPEPAPDKKDDSGYLWL